jgi:hypothetical protein
MTGFFDRVRGAPTTYLDATDGNMTDIRLVIARFGEDPEKVLRQFWKEHDGTFAVVPLFAYGNAPRKELCTARSLAAAVQSVDLETGSAAEQQWKTACEHHCVAWPKRLQQSQSSNQNRQGRTQPCNRHQCREFE